MPPFHKECLDCGDTDHVRKVMCPSQILDHHFQAFLRMHIFLLIHTDETHCVDYNQKEVYYQARITVMLGLVWFSRPSTFLLWAEGGRKGSGDSSTGDFSEPVA